LSGLAFLTWPTPAWDAVGATPHRLDQRFLMYRSNANVWFVVFRKDGLSHKCFSSWISIDVNGATTIQVPRELLIGKVLVI
jgi:hypothetical protein